VAADLEGMIFLGERKDEPVSIRFPLGLVFMMLGALLSGQTLVPEPSPSPSPPEATQPPVLVTMDPVVWIKGGGAVAKLVVEGLADNATASLRTPSGRVLPLTLAVPADGSLSLDIPPQDEVGNYVLFVTNPPNNTLSIKGKLSVHYPHPVVSKVEPVTIEPSGADQTIEITGKDFSPEVIVGFRLGDGGRFSLLNITAATETSLSVTLPADTKPGDYRLTVANAVRDQPVMAGTVHVNASATAKVDSDENLKKKTELQLQIAALDQSIQRKVQEGALKRTFGWISLGVGVLGTAGGVWGYFKGTQDYSSYQAATTSADATSSRNDLNTDGVITVVGGSVGLAGLVATSFLLSGEDTVNLTNQRQNLVSQLQQLGP